MRTRTRRALFFAHPFWLLAVALAGALLAVEYAVASKAGPRAMRVSAVMALVIGLPSVLYTKYLVRRSIAFYSEYSFIIAERAAQLEFWRKNWRNLYANVPLTLAIITTWFASRELQVEWAPMLGMMLILYVLLYPEQEEIHRRIKERADQG
jgi:hypothetical protein